MLYKYSKCRQVRWTKSRNHFWQSFDVVNEIQATRSEIVPHLLSSPDLTPFEFPFLRSILRRVLEGVRFKSKQQLAFFIKSRQREKNLSRVGNDASKLKAITLKNKYGVL